MSPLQALFLRGIAFSTIDAPLLFSVVNAPVESDRISRSVSVARAFKPNLRWTMALNSLSGSGINFFQDLV
jgi:hypothetical protein